MTKPDDIPQDVWKAAVEASSFSRSLANSEASRDFVTLDFAHAIMAERDHCKAVLQQLYDLLHNDTSNGGAASYLPAEGESAEKLVDQALEILRANGIKRYVPQFGDK